MQKVRRRQAQRSLTPIPRPEVAGPEIDPEGGASETILQIVIVEVVPKPGDLENRCRVR